jgi:hypothetical protein
MLAIRTTIVFLVAALAMVMTLSWRRSAARPVPVRATIKGSTCYPKVKR